MTFKGIRGIIVVFTLIMAVKGTWWASAAQPIILSLGAILAAVDLDVYSSEFQNLLPFINKVAESE